MRSLKFKNRIAYYNTLAVGFTTIVVFAVIYFVVKEASYRHLDEDILLEKEEIFTNLNSSNDSIIISKVPEWYETEHNKVEVNPTFIQIVNTNGTVVFHSANLIGDLILFNPNVETGTFYNSEINKQFIRLGQFPIRNHSGKIIGQLTVAISSQESHAILNSLLLVLVVAFPFVLIVQFLASSFAAGRAIQPVLQLIKTASSISDSTIKTRLLLPERKDELYDLTQTINDLLARIEQSMFLQKHFTSDASHEIRTPLSAIRGTLEVLIRKPRPQNYYEEKIEHVIGEVDRLNLILEQLLQLTRIDSGSVLIKSEEINLTELLSAKLPNWINSASLNFIQIEMNLPPNIVVSADRVFLEIILDNLVSNAIKYGRLTGVIKFEWDSVNNAMSVSDDGIGMSREQHSKIFNRFYRIDESRSNEIKGAGLGLAIVKKMCDLQNIEISVKSTLNIGSTFTLTFHR